MGEARAAWQRGEIKDLHDGVLTFDSDELDEFTYDWVDVDIMQGQSRQPEFLAMNPAGQVPLVLLPDGRPLAQSNAIILYLAEGTALLPEDPYWRAKVNELLFWEQYSHEPNIAVCRFHKVYLGKSDGELDPQKVEKGQQALAYMDSRLEDRAYLIGDALSVADIALVAYTRLAHEGGFDVTAYPAVQRWLDRVAAHPAHITMDDPV